MILTIGKIYELTSYNPIWIIRVLEKVEKDRVKYKILWTSHPNSRHHIGKDFISNESLIYTFNIKELSEKEAVICCL
jgi:hypothetical protein